MIINDIYTDMEHASTKEKIVGAAMSLLLQFGFERTTITAIASRAQVNEASVFRIFGNKEGLYNEVYLRLASGPSRVSMDELTGGEDLMGDLEYLFSRYLMIQILHIPANRMYRYNIERIKDQSIYDEYLEGRNTMHAQLRSYLEALAEKGRIAEMDYDTMALFLLSLLRVKAPEFLLGYKSGPDKLNVYDEEAFRQYVKNFSAFVYGTIQK